MARVHFDRARRQQRNANFEIFVQHAQQWFEKFEKNDDRHNFLKTVYGFYVVAGGRDGAVDKDRLFEVFYGSRPIDTAIISAETQIEESRFPIPKQILVSESGGRLTYERGDNGIVVCTLRPAKTENYRRLEDLIILAIISRSWLLTSKPYLEQHWRYFAAYCECSSVDGEPDWTDWLRTQWLLFTKPLVIKGQVQPTRLVSSVKWILQWSLTVGLSGTILAIVQYYLKP